MEENKYLIAIALAEQNNKRIMPLGGKTFKKVEESSQAKEKEAEKIILDLLLRLFKKATEGNLKISKNDYGLLLAEISFERMQKYLPIIKSNWVNSGDTVELINKLKTICTNLWSIQHEKHEGIIFNDIQRN